MTGATRPRFRGVLLDWRGTLVVAPSFRDLVERGLRGAGRPTGPDEVAAVLNQLRATDRGAAGSSRADTDAGLHRELTLGWFRSAGIDTDLAEALYVADSDVLAGRFAVDAPAVLATLTDAGVRVGVLSDIHVDIRPAFASVPAGPDGNGRSLADLVASWTLSFEVGLAKPDPAVFRLACADLELPPGDVLMVGDRSGWDGAAVECGIATLLLPPLESPTASRLQAVLDLVLPGRPSG